MELLKCYIYSMEFQALRRFRDSKMLNKTLRFLRPIVHSSRDRTRVKKIDSDVTKLLPGLAQENLLESSLVVDLGANRGDFTMWSLRKGASVICFEPHPVAFQYLSKRTAGLKGVHRIQAAVSSNSSFTPLFVHPDAVNDQLGYSIRSSIKQEKVGFVPYERVLALSFEEIVDCLPKITVLKVDIEGSEKDIWPQIKSNYKKIKYLLMEVHNQINPSLRSEIEGFIKVKRLEKLWTADWV
jgi:FkbM family methyltransferase